MKKRTSWTHLFFLLCAGVMLLTGCQPVMPATTLNAPAQAAAAQPDFKIARQVAEATTFSDLDPATACVTQGWIFGNVYETLTRYNLPGVEPFILPGLAEEWTVSDDGMTWTFHLRQGVKFHDGSDFNAEAVKFTVERNQQFNQCSAYIYSPVASIETPDAYTVVFRLSQPAPMDAILASAYNAWIMSPSVQDKDAAWFAAGNDAGTGPYRMVQYEPGQRMVLERFDDYWRGWEPGQFDQIVFEFVGDMTTAAQMLQAGQLDYATSRALTPEQMLELDAEEKLTLLATQGYHNWYIYLDHQRAPTDNLQVRQALAYSFPYDAVIATTNLGKGTRSHGVVPTVVWGHDPEPLPYAFDLEKARALLAEAGYADGLELTMSFDPEEQPMAELWQAELAKLKVTLHLAPSDFMTRWEIANSGSPTAPAANTIFWGPDVIGPYTYLAPFNMAVLPDWNLSHYDNPEYNALIDEANVLAVTDRQAATEKFIRAQRMLRDDVAAIFILDKPALEVIASDLTGYIPNPAYGFVPWYEVRR
jgi:peptide/nickel transport system substrate-binding protein